MTTNNYNSFVRQALKLLQNDEYWTSASPKKISNSPIKIKIFDPEESEPTMPIKQRTPIVVQLSTKCNCLKSRCQKQYCDCFAAGKPCNFDCNCLGCNNMSHSHIKKGVQGCNCKKTGCTKKYCECYVKNIKCTYICNCVDCCNQDDSESEKENEPNKRIVLGVLSQDLWKNTQIVQKCNK